MAMIEQNTELEQFERELEENHLTSHWQMFWRRRGAQELLPFAWQWTNVRRLLERSGDLVDIGRADDPNDRRTVGLMNPAFDRLSRTVHVSAQLVKPGEIGEAHRHTFNAMRFVVETSGDIYSTVDGEKMTMERGDLVLTPTWSWHDHTNNSGSGAVWLDIHDANLSNYFGALFKDNWTDGTIQPIIHEDGYSKRRLTPVRPRVELDPLAGGTIPFGYKWKDTEAALLTLASENEIDEWEGVYVDYAHPLTGASTLPTLHCRMHLLPPHTATRRLRRTGITFYHAFNGQGVTLVGEGGEMDEQHVNSPSHAEDNVELTWDTSDCFMVPSWRWQQHRNDSDEPAWIFSVTDAPALKAFGWYREERD